MKDTTTSSKWKATVAVAMSNYIEAGSIIAIATSMSLWQTEFGLDSLAVGLLSALSANAFGAAIGAAIGGPLCDRYGRKFIYTYDLLLYMFGTLFAVFAFNFASCSSDSSSPASPSVPESQQRGPISPRRPLTDAGPVTSASRSWPGRSDR